MFFFVTSGGVFGPLHGVRHEPLDESRVGRGRGGVEDGRRVAADRFQAQGKVHDELRGMGVSVCVWRVPGCATRLTFGTATLGVCLTGANCLLGSSRHLLCWLLQRYCCTRLNI